MANQQVLTVPGRYDQIQTLCEFVAGGARAAGLHEDAVFHIELCCDEASTNIIEHGYGAEDVGPITVSYETRDSAFVVTLRDQGRRFDPSAVPAPRLPQADDTQEQAIGEVMESLQVGGLGIHFMRQLMDEVAFDYDDEKGNALTLVKYLPAEGE